MLAVRTPEAPPTAREDAVFDSAFPFAGQGRLLRSRSISGLFSRSLHSGLQPPCLRFATAVTGRHARLGSRLLARLCRGRHRRRQTSTRLQGATLIKPDVPISGIRLSDCLHRRLTNGRHGADLGAATPPTHHRSVPWKTDQCLAMAPCAAVSGNASPALQRVRQAPRTPSKDFPV